MVLPMFKPSRREQFQGMNQRMKGFQKTVVCPIVQKRKEKSNKKRKYRLVVLAVGDRGREGKYIELGNAISGACRKQRIS